MARVRDYIRALQEAGIQRPRELREQQEEDDGCRLWYYEGKMLSSNSTESSFTLLVSFPEPLSDYLQRLLHCSVKRPPAVQLLQDEETLHIVRQLEKFVLCGNETTFFHLPYSLPSSPTCWLQKQGFQVRHYDTLHHPLTTISWTPPHYSSNFVSITPLSTPSSL